jgi:hypothetical protein
MATSNTTLQVADLDFFSIKENLKNFLRSQSTFTDYDFEGSGMSVLLDVLAYNTYYNSFYLNMAANESFLDTAQIRNNILSHAKLINYVPDSPHGSVSLVNIVVTPSTAEDRNTNVITLDKYTKLVGQDKNGINYPYVTLNSNTSYKSGDAFSFANVMLKQGEVITQQFLVEPTNTTRRFQIPSANVDTDTIVITVQESSSNTTTTEYKLAEDLTEITANSNIYFVEEDDSLKYTVYFGDGVLGKKPKNGNIVIVTYLDTVGAVSNNISKFTFTSPIGGPLYRDNVSVTTIATSYGGTDKEDIEKIRFHAPYYYTAQNRAVTVKDYESLILKDYNNIDSVSIWGGEDNDPIVYGKVYLSLKTRGYYALSNLEKEKIKNSLIENRNVLTIVPEIVDPDYIFLIIKGRVTYNPSLTALSTDEIKTVVKNAIIQYNNDELSKFKSTFKKSKLQYYIENSEKSITASDISVYMQKRLTLTTNQAKNYIINFNSPLKKGDFVNKLYSFPQYTVVDSSAVLRNVFIEEVPDSFTGIDSISITNAGNNYETTPTVTISGDGTGATAVATLVGNRIRSIKVTNKGINYTRATITITGGGGSEGTAIAVLSAKNGIIRTFYYKANGEKVVVNGNAGTIDYDTGRVTLNAVTPLGIVNNDFYDTDVVTVNAVPSGDIIYPLRNRILAVDENNFQSIQIEVVAES